MGVDDRAVPIIKTYDANTTPICPAAPYTHGAGMREVAGVHWGRDVFALEA
jgi:hypothetical protein